MSRQTAGKALLLVFAAVFLLLRFVHLSADYPRNIRWDDGIATDEGWYASAAVNAHAWGTPSLAGDMNIPVLMPVWPMLARLGFLAGGFGIVPLRTLAAFFFIADVFLLVLLLRRYGATAWAPLLLLMMAVNPWSFAFSRSGFLEFPMLCFVLVGVLLAAGSSAPPRERFAASRVAAAILAGVAFALALLLKTTGVALAPVLLYALLQRCRFRWARAAGEAVLLFGAAAAVYGVYWWFQIRPDSADVTFYLSVVKNTLRLTPLGFVADASRPFRYGLGSDHLLFSLTLVTLALSVVVEQWRALFRDPLYVIAAVWFVSFLAFMVKHNNDPARYFAVVIPAAMLVAVALLRNREWSGPRTRRLLLGAVVLDVAGNAVQVSAAMLHPRYSFRTAAQQIEAIVRADPSRNDRAIGDNMHEIALQASLKPVNLLFHAANITEQMQRYQPGWWVQFKPIEDGRCFRQVLHLAYTAERRGEWQIFYPGQSLVLWRLTPILGASLPAVLTPEQTAACAPPVYN